MTDDSTYSGSGSPEEENLRRFLRDAFGGSIPEDVIAGMDLSELAKHANIPSDPAQMQSAMRQMQHLFSSQEGPVNWDVARDVAKQTAVAHTPAPGMPDLSGTTGDPGPTNEQVTQLREAAHVARLWLAPVVDIDVPAQEMGVFSRGTWLQRTLPRWQSIVEPVAKYMASAIGEALAAQLQSAEVTPMGDPAAMMERMGGTLFGVQFGYAIGALARELTGTTDLSLPLGNEGEPALVAVNVDDLVQAHSLDASAARIFLATRELAHISLFHAFPWLSKSLFAAIDDYARGITLDMDALDEMVRNIDLSDPSAMQAQGPEQMFVFTRRASQERALEELATTLALVEAWVDHVTAEALQTKLPQLEAMREVLRRRRASGSPAEEMLTSTVGIELRPRRVREALAWWESVLATEGTSGREAIWQHPDLLPTAEVLAGTPQAPHADATTAVVTDAAPTEQMEGMQFPTDFDSALEEFLDAEQHRTDRGEAGDPEGGSGAGDDSDPSKEDDEPEQ